MSAIKLPNGYTFEYSAFGEVCGFVSDATGKVVPGSSGFFRTECPNEAAKLAAGNLFSDGLITADDYLNYKPE